MEEKKLVPTSLRIVAYLFILGAVIDTATFMVKTINLFTTRTGSIYIPLGILGFFIGPGLLKLKRGR